MSDETIARLPAKFNEEIQSAILDIEYSLAKLRRERETSEWYNDKRALEWIDRQVSAVPIVKEILPKLKVGEVWLNNPSGDNRRKTEALLFEVNGFQFALFGTTHGDENTWGVADTVTGAKLGRTTSDNISDALIRAMAMFHSVSREEFLTIQHQWTREFGEANPSAQTQADGGIITGKSSNDEIAIVAVTKRIDLGDAIGEADATRETSAKEKRGDQK
jgi:hypothetical protein